jgi:hypothetical protein
MVRGAMAFAGLVLPSQLASVVGGTVRGALAFAALVLALVRAPRLFALGLVLVAFPLASLEAFVALPLDASGGDIRVLEIEIWLGEL